VIPKNQTAANQELGWFLAAKRTRSGSGELASGGGVDSVDRLNWGLLARRIFFISGLAFISFRIDSLHMTPIHAKVVSTGKCDDHYRLIIDLVPSEFLGPFERLRFRKKPYCGSFSTSLTKSWLTLTYRKDPGFKTGEVFPLSRTN
jgi:hypothetical protein